MSKTKGELFLSVVIPLAQRGILRGWQFLFDSERAEIDSAIAVFDKLRFGELPTDELKFVEEVEASHAKTTPGKWKLWAMNVMSDVDGTNDVKTAKPICRTLFVDDEGRRRTFNADFIALAHEAAPTLCAMVQAKHAENAELRERAAKVEGLESSLRRMQEERDEARKTVAFLHKVSADKDARIKSLELSLQDARDANARDE